MKTHDFTQLGWGHNVDHMWDLKEMHAYRVAGHSTPIVNDGDFLILKNGEGTTRYQARNVEHVGNPRDMWFADIHFAPRTVTTKI